MENIKLKVREMFDEKFPEEFFMHDNCECWNETGEPTCYQYEQIKIREFIDQIIDLAIAERDKEIVEMIEKDLNTYWRHPMALFPKDRTPQSELKEMKVKDDIINLINSKK